LTKWEKRESKSEIKIVNQLRNFICLALSSLIIPSVLLSTMDGIFKYFQYKSMENMFIRVFTISSGSFFISYLVQYTFVGNAVDLLRLKEVSTFIWRKSKSQTPKQIQEAYNVFSFDSFFECSYVLSSLAIVLCYSVLSPMILVAGLVLLVFKYFVDHQKLLFSKEKDIYQLQCLIQLMVFVILFFQFMMLFFFMKTLGILSFHCFVLVVLFVSTFMYCHSIYKNFYLDDNDIILDKQNDNLKSNFSQEEIDEAYRNEQKIFEFMKE
jgi:hypothetical protein